MKKYCMLVPGFFLSVFTMAQSPSNLLGEWKVTLENQDKEWILKRTEPDSLSYRDWGRFFEFNEDGSYSEYASAPCGLDDNHYRYHGKWSYHKASGLIELKEITVVNDRPNIYKDYKVLGSGSLKVLSFQNGELKVKVEKAWEKTSEKK
jgi:hypothetical protein